MASIGDPDGNGQGNYKAPAPFWDKRPIQRGSRVILVSDGITDNLETEEVVDLIRGKTALEAIAIIDDVTSRRMANKQEIIDGTPDRKASGRFVDGFVLRPKQDNRGIAIIEIPR
jgi:serine/threonine protein phosphatase PrpC